tara:strand:- start:158 stop:877 length:720 start_codon:yes stop_codon:yes gene_type:complete
MASISYTNDTPNALMNLLDEHKESISEHEYVKMCNYLQEKYKNVPSKMISRRTFEDGEKVLFGTPRIGHMRWARIIRRGNSTNSYLISIDGEEALIDVMESHLFDLYIPDMNTDNNILGNDINFECPKPNIKTKNKIILDVKYRRFMQTESKYSIKDCQTVVSLLGFPIPTIGNGGPRAIGEPNIDYFIRAINGLISKEEFDILLDDVRNNRCKNSEEYKKIRKEYNEMGFDDDKLAFD